MLRIEEAKRIAHGTALSKRDCLLVLLAVAPTSSLTVREIKNRCLAVGLPKLAKINISDALSRSTGLAARTSTGWELQQAGLEKVRDLAARVAVNLVVTHASKSLRAQLDLIKDSTTKSFVGEAIECFEAKQYRAAVVFSWAGAISLLHQHIFAQRLVDFNTEAASRDPKWRPAKRQEDFGRMKEHDFLQVCEDLGVLGKTTKMVLQNECLTLRNGCGHPNTLSIAENSVAAHIEKLIKNVFCCF